MRHELVWLSETGWAQLIAAAGSGVDSAPAAALAGWRERGWPMVVRRREPGLAAGLLCLGLPLPPAADGSKPRLAFQVEQAAVLRRQPPLRLLEAAAVAPPAWRPALGALLADGGQTLRVFGSLAMQALTGQPYLRPQSDLDLLLYPSTLPQLYGGLALLLRHAGTLPLDGEIVFPGGAAVAWKEWAGASAPGQRVLVKTLDGVHLAPKANLLATLEAA